MSKKGGKVEIEEIKPRAVASAVASVFGRHYPFLRKFYLVKNGKRIASTLKLHKE